MEDEPLIVSETVTMRGLIFWNKLSSEKVYSMWEGSPDLSAGPREEPFENEMDRRWHIPSLEARWRDIGTQGR